MNFKILIRQGLYATTLLLAISLLSLAFFGTSPKYFDIGEIIGYSSITLSMVFVYWGIKQYRDDHLNGSISFWQAMKVGLLIALFPALAFGLYNIVYVEFIDPQFMDKYYAHELSKMEATMAPTDFAAAKEQMEAEKELFMSPVVQFFVMFLTVWLIGLVATIISSLPLTKQKPK